MTHCKYCGYKVGVKACCSKPSCFIIATYLTKLVQSGTCPKCKKENALIKEKGKIAKFFTLLRNFFLTEKRT